MVNRFSPGCGCCDPCEEAPSRTTCQYRSGANGQTLTARPTVAIHFELSGTQTPGCGTCDFDEDYTYTCNVSISDTFLTCTIGANQRTCLFEAGIGANGFYVRLQERVRHSGVTVGYRFYSYEYVYDDFNYIDCDGNPQTDVGGAATFSLYSSSVSESNHADMCWMDVDVLTATNN